MPRQRRGAGLVARYRVAPREYHPVGVELELGHLARGKQPVIEPTGLRRDSKRQSGYPGDIA